MPGKKKPFVDKTKSVTFRLVHRSQKDPFIADPEAGDRVLAPVSSQRDKRGDVAAETTSVVSVKRKEEQAKYGVYFDDDYDYLQHLKDVNEVVCLEPVEERCGSYSGKQGRKQGLGEEDMKVSELRLPASLFECRDVELKVGLLNQAAPAPGPHPEMDPDIVAILEDDEENMEFEELEDDFVAKANAQLSGEGNNDVNEGKGEMESDFDDDDDDKLWTKEETRSRFTEYSISSSVIPRSEGLQQLDARFEKIYEQYDDSEVGSLGSDEDDLDESDAEEGGGTGLIDLSSKRMLDMAEEFAKEQRGKMISLAALGKFTDDNSGTYNVNSDDESMDRIYVSDEPADRFDCDTIVSTYSNLYNHPTLIKEESDKKVRLNAKTGLPIGALRSDSGLTKRNLNQLPTDDQTGMVKVHSVVSSNTRSKDETPEERRLRKQAVKLERKERRCEKKANKVAFKDEEIRRQHVDMNLKQHMQGLKLS